MKGMPPEKKLLLMKLSEKLERYGVNAYTLETRQLKTYDQMFDAMERMARAYAKARAEMNEVALTKASLARESGISESTLRHDPKAARIIEGFAREHGMITDAPSSIDPEKNALKKRVAELEAQVNVMQRLVDEAEKVSLDLFAEKKITTDLLKQLNEAKRAISEYYGKLDQIRHADAAWAEQINQFFNKRVVS